jgi:hypothetical protein
LQTALADTAYSATSSLSDLRLRWFVEANRLDPIFALEGTDPTELEESVGYLEKQRDMFADSYPPSDAAAIREYLYPISFLRLLPELERERQELLAGPTTARALTYSAALVDTIDAYESDARTLAHALQNLDLDTYRFVYVGGSTKTSIMASSLFDIVQEAEAQKQKALARTACLTSFSAGCPSLDALVSVRVNAVKVHESLPPPTEETYAIGSIARELAQNERGFLRASPALVSLPSACQPYDPAYFLVWWKVPVGDSLSAFRSELANDIYIHDLAEESDVDPETAQESRLRGVSLLYNEALVKAGGRFHFQSSGNSYMCPDAGLDDSNLVRVTSLLAALRQAPLFRDIPENGADTALLSSEEARLLSLSAVSIADTDGFVRDILQRLDMHPSELASLDAEHAARLERFIAKYIQGSDHSDELLRSVGFDNAIVGAFARLGDRMPLSALLVTRTAPSILFFTGNPTFIPSSRVNFFDTSGSYRGPYLQLSTYRSLLDRGDGSETLVRSMVRTQDIESSFYIGNPTP